MAAPIDGVARVWNFLGAGAYGVIINLPIVN